MSKVISRREFMQFSAVGGVGIVAGCATNPVTGESQFMLVPESSDVSLDRKWAPHQFSSDYGASQDGQLNAYVNQVGRDMAPHTHRPRMPYNTRVVNSVIVNGYTMPGGSIGLCRGLMLAFQNEAELAAVLGHEFGHVNYRHAGEKMSKTLSAQVLMAGLSSYVQKEYREYASLAAGLGGIGANLLLSRYSRDDEREADEIGMEYASRAGHNPAGMVGVMQTFMKMNSSTPSSVDVLFRTHPLSQERYKTATARLNSHYAAVSNRDENRERYMDQTARLRAIAPAIQDMQNGQQAMLQKKYTEAEGHLKSALQKAPNDYAGLLMLSKCYLAQNRKQLADQYAEQAKRVYPQEAQARHVSGMAKVQRGQFEAALSEFSSYERMLPGNANTVFYKGLCFDQMGRRNEATREYARYRNVAPSGEFSRVATGRLVQWGVLPPAPQQR